MIQPFKKMDKDYIKGMKLLLRMAKVMGYNIRKHQWIPYFCRFLSKQGACEKFWVGVQEQNALDNLDRIVDTCEKSSNPFTPKIIVSCLLVWDRTKEGGLFWSTIWVNGSSITLK